MPPPQAPPQTPPQTLPPPPRNIESSFEAQQTWLSLSLEQIPVSGTTTVNNTEPNSVDNTAPNSDEEPELAARSKQRRHGLGLRKRSLFKRFRRPKAPALTDILHVGVAVHTPVRERERPTAYTSEEEDEANERVGLMDTQLMRPACAPSPLASGRTSPWAFGPPLALPAALPIPDSMHADSQQTPARSRWARARALVWRRKKTDKDFFPAEASCLAFAPL